MMSLICLMCQAVNQRTVTEAVIYYTVYLLELAVNVPKPDAGRKVCFQFILSIYMSLLYTGIAFSALTLLVGWQEGHPACKKL